MMAHRIIANPEDLHSLFTLLGGLKMPFTVEWVQGRDRSSEQNKLQWLWANEAAQQLGDRTASDIQREWKLRHGVPILRADSPDFRMIYDKRIKPLPYEDKVRIMDLIEVTSIMKVRQMVSFLDAVERECAEQGIRLTDPDPDLAKYQSRYRQKQAA